MSYVLETRKQRTPQYNAVRRHGSTPSGVCVIHTAEGNGAANVLAWILSRPDYGSYHRLVDADTTLKLAPWSAETFHCRFTNPHSVGISAAVKAADWARLYQEGRKPGPEPASVGSRIIDRMAIEAADFVRYMAGRGVEVPLRRISRSDALNKRPGFLAHGDTDPGRRTDPGKDFDWAYFFDRTRVHLGTATAPAPSKPTAKPKPAAGGRVLRTHYTRVIDGQPGPYTWTAVQEFLADRGLYDRQVDGQPGPYTWRGLQQYLSLDGFYTRQVDGDPGPYTIRALQTWLTRAGHYDRVIDGIAGPYTWRALQSFLATPRWVTLAK